MPQAIHGRRPNHAHPPTAGRGRPALQSLTIEIRRGRYPYRPALVHAHRATGSPPLQKCANGRNSWRSQFMPQAIHAAGQIMRIPPSAGGYGIRPYDGLPPESVGTGVPDGPLHHPSAGRGRPALQSLTIEIRRGRYPYRPAPVHAHRAADRRPYKNAPTGANHGEANSCRRQFMRQRRNSSAFPHIGRLIAAPTPSIDRTRRGRYPHRPGKRSHRTVGDAGPYAILNS